MKVPFSAMILAAGFGKRMLPITKNVPKPLVTINNVSLLKNSIDFLFRIGCKKIIINTHYKHKLISNFISINYPNSNILLSYENDILDTGGGVKNALGLFDEEKLLVTNSDIFWTKDNEKDVLEFILNFKLSNGCSLLLVDQNNSFGIKNKKGDFSIQKKLIKRWTYGDKIIYYSGLQLINLEIIRNINLKKFSFNYVWDIQINNNSLYGNIMKSNLFHIGDIETLKEVVKSST